MARIVATGRASKIVYGTLPLFSFRVSFPTPNYANATGLNPNWGGTTWDSYTYSGNVQNTSSAPTTGTLTIAGVTVTLVAADIVNPANVAAKIIAATITGFTPWTNTPSNQPDVIFLQGTSVGHLAKPTVALGTATNILFSDISYVDGVAFPSLGAQDDILVRGRTPVQLTLVWTGSGTPTVAVSYGTDQEQSAGLLTYSAALTFSPTTSGGTVTLTAPPDYVKVTTVTGNTSVSLYLTR